MKIFSIFEYLRNKLRRRDQSEESSRNKSLALFFMKGSQSPAQYNDDEMRNERYAKRSSAKGRRKLSKTRFQLMKSRTQKDEARLLPAINVIKESPKSFRSRFLGVFTGERAGYERAGIDDSTRIFTVTKSSFDENLSKVDSEVLL